MSVLKEVIEKRDRCVSCVNALGYDIGIRCPAGRPTQSQLDWLNLMPSEGYSAALCMGWLAAKDTICNYLGIQTGEPQ